MKTKQSYHSSEDKKLFEDIEKYGLHILFVSSSNYLPSFGYTVGLYKTYNHPEIICFGISERATQAVMNNISDLLKSGKKVRLNKTYYDFFHNVQAQFIEVDMSYIQNYFGYDIWLYETINFPAIQLVWADRQNNFPWDKNYDTEFKYRQPLLDRNAGFKFREEKNLGIFTTRQWLELNKPILRVVHDYDGNWQFLTGDQLPEDIRLVCLEEVVQRDTTLNDIFDLDYGECAERESIDDKWTRAKVTIEEQ